MINKLAIIGLVIFFNLLLPKSAFATSGFMSYAKPVESEITYDIPDSGDNAHPSGKDRSVEPGRSLTQGKSSSDPDNNGTGPERNYGKSDKPGSTGGVDKFDQDGNNGCGNDDDFEDDNEGWCGRKPKNEKPDPCKEKCDRPDEEKCDTPNECKPCEDPKDSPDETDRLENGGTPTNPTLATNNPTVLAAVTRLPQTGNEAYWSLVLNLVLAASLALIGIFLNLVYKYRYNILKK